MGRRCVYVRTIDARRRRLAFPKFDTDSSVQCALHAISIRLFFIFASPSSSSSHAAAKSRTVGALFRTLPLFRVPAWRAPDTRGPLFSFLLHRLTASGGNVCSARKFSYGAPLLGEENETGKQLLSAGDASNTFDQSLRNRRLAQCKIVREAGDGGP